MWPSSAHLQSPLSISVAQARATHVQATVPVGRVEVLYGQDEDLRAAAVLLSRSFATAPDNARVSVGKVE